MSKVTRVPATQDATIVSPLSKAGEVKVEEISVAATNILILEELRIQNHFWEIFLS